MDLRSVLNDNGERGEARNPPLASIERHPQPQPQPQPQPAAHQRPPSEKASRPQSHYPPPPNAGQMQQHPAARSPAGGPQHQRHSHPPPPPPPQHHDPHRRTDTYPPASPYQAPGSYGRPAPPPPLQHPGSYHDGRSPLAMPAPGPPPSPYRSATTPSSASTSVAGYPFPPTHNSRDAISPSMRHQFPPANHSPPPPQPQQPAHGHGRESIPPRGVSAQPRSVQVSPQAAPAHLQQRPQQHYMSQTPPTAPNAAGHAYHRGSSHSAHSTPTPNSSHGQRPFAHPSFSHESPTMTMRRSPVDMGHHLSLPTTTVGTPLSPGGVRHPSAPGPLAPSLYQQRSLSTASPQVEKQNPMSLQQQPLPLHVQASPRHQSSAELPRRASMGFGSHNSQASSISDSQRYAASHSEREQSVSVSPKTRIPSLASQPQRTSSATDHITKSMMTNQNSMDIDHGKTAPSGKRKLEDRELSPRELERKETRPPPGTVNGDRSSSVASSDKATPKNRNRYAKPPPWATSIRSHGKQPLKHVNFVLSRPGHSQTNGRRNTASLPKREHTSGQPSPEASGRSQAAPSVNAAEPGPQEILGQWEASLTGIKPFEEVSRRVADFLFIHVLNNPDFHEISSRQIQFEIEAKLGTLIDKDTKQRVSKQIETECILQDNGRTAFTSSMTEHHHKAFNEFLNMIVVATNPKNPNKDQGRVPVNYSHTRELDRFYDLTGALQDRLPGCMRSRFRGKQIKARVTYDLKSKSVLKKIIKARIADLDLHLPSCPMDCRISLNLEMDWDGPVKELESQPNTQPDRNKDRLSYSQGHYQVDLTQVTQMVSAAGGNQSQQKEHELEIELAPRMMIEQGRRAMNGEPHRYQELVEGLVDNVRTLARKARDFSQ